MGAVRNGLLIETASTPKSEPNSPLIFKTPPEFVGDPFVRGSIKSYANSVTSYLNINSPTKEAPESLRNGCIYEYTKGHYDAVPDFTFANCRKGVIKSINFTEYDELLFLDSDTDKKDIEQTGNFALKFSGWLQVPLSGHWTFYLSSNDGSVLYLQNRKVIDNDGMVNSQHHSLTALYP
jgi:hypothetical protein